MRVQTEEEEGEDEGGEDETRASLTTSHPRPCRLVLILQLISAFWSSSALLLRRFWGGPRRICWRRGKDGAAKARSRAAVAAAEHGGWEGDERGRGGRAA